MSEHLNLDDCRSALAGDGPLAGQWLDKPHRLVMDLVAECERLRGENETLRLRIEGLESALEAAAVDDCPYCDGLGEVCESCGYATADCECEATGRVMCIDCEGTGKDQEI